MDVSGEDAQTEPLSFMDGRMNYEQMLNSDTLLPEIDDLLNQNNFLDFSSTKSMNSDSGAYYSSSEHHDHSDLDMDHIDSRSVSVSSSYDDLIGLEDDHFDMDISHSSSSDHDHDHHDHHDHDSHSEPELVKHKKYRQPASLEALNLTIGPWKVNDSSKPIEQRCTLEVKFLFGRRRIKYEISQINSKRSLLMDFELSSISGIKYRSKEKILIFQLCEPPNFYAKERGKCVKIADFTQGSASLYQRHVIELAHPYDEQVDKLFATDKRLRTLTDALLASTEATFANVDEKDILVTLCDWDKENGAVVFCEECNSNFCEDCDDVLHRHATRKLHKRIPIANSTIKAKKSKKRKKTDRCRCGTGATKGTLGEPCTGNRCPCFSNGKSCGACGCKNCANPFKLKKNNSSVNLVPSGSPTVPHQTSTHQQQPQTFNAF